MMLGLPEPSAQKTVTMLMSLRTTRRSPKLDTICWSRADGLFMQRRAELRREKSVEYVGHLRMRGCLWEQHDSAPGWDQARSSGIEYPRAPASLVQSSGAECSITFTYRHDTLLHKIVHSSESASNSWGCPGGFRG